MMRAKRASEPAKRYEAFHVTIDHIHIVLANMRGITVKVGREEKEKWCSFAYEFLPDFCYTCERVGHIDKQCEVRLEAGETQQFSKCLRYIPEKKKMEGFQDRSSQSGRLRGGWIGGGSGSRGSHDGRDNRSGRWASSGSGSDAARWRKEEGEKSGEKEEEMLSPLKAPPKPMSHRLIMTQRHRRSCCWSRKKQVKGMMHLLMQRGLQEIKKAQRETKRVPLSVLI
ncbi:unnamed protein product [Miscanthus lutarioriparius]|uniref:CCHC-type domain-containing protein n=1 Tax=Miscanthus lutarioriparius TaxID=422564 RepID=A0A811PP02_9POAL|nr:unnamed protein product [Miscanthus lutarioriparius]